jgi:hypothetical protein
MNDYSPEALWTGLIRNREPDPSAPFGQRVYDRIVRLVPCWRASTDAWSLSDGSHLVGIGVLRNYGGDLLVITIDSREDETIGQLVAVLGGDLSLRNGRIENVLVVFDDSVLRFEELPRTLWQLERLPWSSAASLALYIIKDNPGDEVREK